MSFFSMGLGHKRVVVALVLRSSCSGIAQRLPNVSAAIKVDENRIDIFVEYNFGRINAIMDELKRVKTFNAGWEVNSFGIGLGTELLRCG